MLSPVYPIHIVDYSLVKANNRLLSNFNSHFRLWCLGLFCSVFNAFYSRPSLSGPYHDSNSSISNSIMKLLCEGSKVVGVSLVDLIVPKVKRVGDRII